MESAAVGHALYLVDGMHSKKPIRIPAAGNNNFSRAVDIFWLTDNRRFVLNDWLGSERTVSYLYEVRHLESPIAISEKILPILKKRFGNSNIKAMNFLYIYVDKIFSKRQLQIRVRGVYTKPDNTPSHPSAVEVNSTYSWDLKGKFGLLHP
jgi:hypothetical protein